MAVGLLLARLVLAAVLAVAGVAKLLDRPGTRKAVVDFGAPAGLAVPLAAALPAAELATAGLLLPAATAWYGAHAALALFTVFTGAIAFALARGRAPDCNCFGQLGAQPVGAWTLVRNGLLIVLAAAVAIAGWDDVGPSAVAWIGDLDTAGVVAMALAVALAVVLFAGATVVTHVLRSHGSLLLRIELLERTLVAAGITPDSPIERAPEIGLPPGVPAPAVRVATLDGEPVSLRTLLTPGVPLLLLFTSPRCAPCRELMPVVRGWQQEHAGEITIALASDGDAKAVREEAERLSLENMFLDEGLGAYAAFGAEGTPSAVLVAPDGTVASHVVSGVEWIAQLVDETVAHPEPVLEEGLAVGAITPDLRLEDLEGRRVALSEFRGRETVLLFWNPGCGFCRDMHEDLRTWETGRNGGDPRLVVVSAGDPAAIAEEGFESPVLVDGGSAASNAFGAGGTPMAVRLNAEGRVRSRVLAGAVGVMALLDSPSA